MKNGRKTQASTKVKASTNSRDNDQDNQEGSEPGEVRVSTVLTNGPCCNFECDNYINNKKAIREAMCFMMDPNLGKYVYFVQFSQRFDGIDRNDRYVNRNTVLFDINLRGLDGIQRPVYVGIGCVFYQTTLYGYEPPHKPKTKKEASLSLCCGGLRNKGSKPIRKGSDKKKSKHVVSTMPIFNLDDIDERVEGLENLLKTRKYFTNKSPTCSRDQ